MYINLITIDLCPGQGGGGVKPSGSLEISSNGVYNVYSYASASVDVHPSASLSETYTSNGSYNITGEFNGGVITVDVPAPQFVTETLNVSANGTYTPGEGVDGYSQVVVDVPQSVTGFTDKDLTEGNLNIVNLNNSASFVASNAFYKNNTIQTVNLPYATSVGNNAFYRCSSLSQVSLPVCSYIGDDAFNYCSSLSQVNLPVCSKIQTFAFNGCSSLTQVSLPMCSYINEYAFQQCNSLSEVSLPVCNHIGRSAFQQCNNLSSIVLPMVTNIEQNAFRDCIMFGQITLGASSVCSISDITLFLNTLISSSTGSIYVPSSLVNDYKTTRYWRFFSTQIFPIPE